MIRYVFVDNTGLPRNVAEPAIAEEFVAGQTYGDLLCLRAPDGVDNLTLLTSYYYKDGQLRTREPQPSAFHRWDMANTKWVEDLALAKDHKNHEINRWRDAQRMFFEWNGHRWDSDMESRANILGMVIAGLAPLNGYWTSADNEDIPVTTPEEMQAMYQAMLIKDNAVHDRQRQMKLEVASMTTLDEILAYPVGWPE